MHHKVLATMVLAVVCVSSLRAHADAPASLGNAGDLQRATLDLDDTRGATGASFGAPLHDDHRMFVLRWRLPALLSFGALGPTAFVSGYHAALGSAGGVALAVEPTSSLSAFVPQLAFGQAGKVVHVELGALSSSMGNGTIVDRFTNSPDGQARRGGALLEGNLAGLAGSVMLADVTRPSELFAVRLAGRPVMWFLAPDAVFQPNELDVDPRTEVLVVWLTGVSLAADTSAPTARGTTSVLALGWDNALALVDTGPLKLIGTVDVNSLTVGNTRGLGVHGGVKAAVDMAGVHVDGTLDAYTGGNGYTPRYFDRLYFVERTTTLGSTSPKADLGRPASSGMQVRLQASALQSVALFVEANAHHCNDVSQCSASGTVRAGASAFVMGIGVVASAAQAGITDWTQPHVFGPGFVVEGEARWAVLFNTVNLVGRAWRAQVPAGSKPDQFLMEQGATFGVELNFDVL